jgi:hypothetical protein
MVPILDVFTPLSREATEPVPFSKADLETANNPVGGETSNDSSNHQNFSARISTDTQ